MIRLSHYHLNSMMSLYSHSLVSALGRKGRTSVLATDRMMSDAAPPTNESAIHQWTVGPLFYSALVVAEALGTTNTSQVKDLLPDGNDLTPAYAIYEDGNLARIALINFMTDPSGANDFVATVNIGGQQFGEANSVPTQAKVK